MTQRAPVRAISSAQIYCPTCESIQPLVVDDPQPAVYGAYDCATDLVCGGCQFVIATTYTLRAPKVQEGDVRKAA